MANRCPHAGHFMWWSASVLAMSLTSRPGFVICNAYDLVLKDDVVGIVHHEPLVGKVRVCKHLEMVTVADLFLCIDVDPDCFHEALKAHKASTCRNRSPSSLLKNPLATEEA